MIAGRGRILGVGVLLAVSAGLVVQGKAGEHPAEHDGHGESHDHKNHVALFLGSTQSEEHHGERDDPSFTVGIDYERRLTKIFGMGLLADFVVEGDRELLLGVPVSLHAGSSAKLLVAPCVHKLRDADDYDYVLRTGLVWDFTVGKGTVSPSIYYDFAEHHDLFVIGLGIGRGW